MIMNTPIDRLCRALVTAVLMTPAVMNGQPVLAQTPPKIVMLSNNISADRYSDQSSDGARTFPASTSPDTHGKGGVFTDLNNDGFPDLYLPRGHLYAENSSDAINALWLYDPPTGTWVLTPGVGAGDPGAGVAAAAADFDNDGDTDLYIANYNEPNVLLRNMLVEEGAIRFEDVTDQTVASSGPGMQLGVGLAAHHGVLLDATFTAVWADVDRDGDLDVFISSHEQSNILRAESSAKPPGAGERTTLYLNLLNEGDVSPGGVPRFRDVTMIAGGDLRDATGAALPTTGATGVRIASPGVTSGTFADGRHNTPTKYFNTHMSAIASDLNNDGWPELVVISSVASYLYRNLGSVNGVWGGFELDTFENIQRSSDTGPFVPFGSGVTTPMGITTGDYDNDGDFDVFITGVGTSRNDVLTNLFDGSTLTFHRQAEGAFTSEAISWGAFWLDDNNDGMLDIAIAPQRTNLSQQLEGEFNLLLFTSLGLNAVNEREYAVERLMSNGNASVGILVADFDQDGYVDLLTRGGTPSASDQLWRNVTMGAEPNMNHWVTLKLIGDPTSPGPNGLRSTRDAIGARVTLVSPILPFGQPMREVRAGGGNSSATSSQDVHLGLGSADDVILRIDWPSERTTTVHLGPNAAAPGGAGKTVDQRLVIREISADLNNDGVVNGADISNILNAFGQAAAGLPEDLSGDGVVNGADISILLNLWGPVL